MLFLLIERGCSPNFFPYQNVRPRPWLLKSRHSLNPSPAEMSYSIPIRQETMLSPAPFFTVACPQFGVSTIQHQALPLSAPTIPCLITVPKSFQTHWELNKWHQSTLGWKAEFCPWHWELPQDLAGHATGLWFSEHCFWQQYQLKWPSAPSSPIEILPPLLTSSPGPLPQPSWYNCAVGKKTAPEKGSDWLSSTES